MRHLYCILICTIFLIIPLSSYSQLHDHKHNHYYRIYTGRFKDKEMQTAKPVNYRNCIFKKSNKVSMDAIYINNTKTARHEGSIFNRDYYIVKLNTTVDNRFPKKDKLILQVNRKIKKYHIMETKKTNEKGPVAKGNYGCFPSFIVVNGDLDYFVDNGVRKIQLPLAKHVQNQTIYEELEILDFPISITNYESINNKLKTEPYLHGGINKDGNDYTLLIYLPNDVLWDTFEEFD